jgi:GGDEF domain-containing protein
VMDREASRAVKRRAPIAIVTLQLEPPTAGSSHASHDLVQTVAQRVRSGMPRDWFAARAADLEVVVVAPETSRENAEHQARGWLQSCSSTTTPALALGVAEFGGDLQDATVVLAAARANAKRYQSSG